MGYFKRPVRRGAARKARIAFLEPARELRAGDWRRCDRSLHLATDTFFRFAIDCPRRRRGRVGLFRAWHLIEESEDLPAAVRSQLRAAFRWFNAKLEVPRRLPRSAVCWFRSDARESMERLTTLIEAYRLAGHTVWMQTTRTPGRIVYRDEHQVAAVPYADRRTTSSAA